MGDRERMTSRVRVLGLVLLGSLPACTDDDGAGDTAADDASTGTSTSTDTSTSTSTDTSTDTGSTGDTSGTAASTSGGGGEGDPCHPLAGACDDGLGCYPVPADMFECGPEGSAGASDKCNNDADCADGLYCAASISLVDCKGPQCCTPFCDLDAPDCPDGYGCQPYFPGDGAPAGLDDVGICLAN
jgi:hypothetical protein